MCQGVNFVSRAIDCFSLMFSPQNAAARDADTTLSTLLKFLVAFGVSMQIKKRQLGCP